MPVLKEGRIVVKTTHINDISWISPCTLIKSNSHSDVTYDVGDEAAYQKEDE